VDSAGVRVSLPSGPAACRRTRTGVVPARPFAGCRNRPGRGPGGANDKLRREELADLVRPVMEAEGYELVECSVSRTARSQTFRIAIDREAGVPLAACERASRLIAGLLDANPLLRGAYQLEVSSAGMNRPIWSEAHFQRFRNERVRIELADAGAPRRTLTGVIAEVLPGAGGPAESTGRDAPAGPGEPAGDAAGSAAGSAAGEAAGEAAGSASGSASSAGARGAAGETVIVLRMENGDERRIALREIGRAQVQLDPWKRRPTAHTDEAREE